MASGSQVGSIVFGGLFIGIWLYIALFGVPAEMDEGGDFSVAKWLVWGLVGLALAGAIYGTRVASGGVRVALFVAIGIAIGLLVTAFLFNDLQEGIATLVTLVGGGLIVSALPVALREQQELARQARGL